MKVLNYVGNFAEGWSTGAGLTIGATMLVTGIKAKSLDKKSRAYLIFTGGAMVYDNGKRYVNNLVEAIAGVKECIADQRKEDEVAPYEEWT